MNFKKIDLNNLNINKYKSKCKSLSHIRTGKDYKGYIYIDKQDDVVGFINMRLSDKYIQAIEVSPEYQGNGLGKTLLNELIKMGAIRLSVNKKNTKAKKMYDKLFNVEREDEHMYYMVLEISDYLKERRGLSNMKSFSFKDLNTINILTTENYNIINKSNENCDDVIVKDISNINILTDFKNKLLNESFEVLYEADDDLGPTDYNADDLGGGDANTDDDTGGGDDLGPTDYNEDDTTADNDTDDNTTNDDTTETDNDLDSLESDTDDPTTEPNKEGDGSGDVENSNDEQMNNDNDQDNENNKFLIKDYLELYNRLEEILEKITSNETFKFSRDVVYNKARINIEKIKDMLFDYITLRFNKESYISNLYHFNMVIQAVNVNVAMIEKSPTVTEIQNNIKNQQKTIKNNKNEKKKRS